MVAAVLRRGGGLRVDHVLGLFRLWWIPAGSPASAGTYVRYDADAMLGILALEAARFGALVVGEDLGTVEDSVAAALEGAGVLGSTVAWFERDGDDQPIPPGLWRSAAMASVTTHDLPTVAGWLAGEHVRVRARRGLLRRSEAEELAAWRAERATLLDLLVVEGFLDRVGPASAASPASAAGPQRAAGGPGPTDTEVALALHGLLVRSPSRIVLASPGDAIGDVRQPNLPGTTDAYPNWRLPMTDGAGRVVSLEDVLVHPGVARLAHLLARVHVP
jgi:4-alpha-glucanotransferase